MSISPYCLNNPEVFATYLSGPDVFISGEDFSISRQDFWNEVNKLSNSQSDNGQLFVPIECQNNYQDFLLVSSLWRQNKIPVLIGNYWPQASKEKLINHCQLFNEQAIDQYQIDKPALVIFTSGSSGFPKAVLLTFKNLYNSALGLLDYFKLEAGDTWALNLPTSHIGGFSLFTRALFGNLKIQLTTPDKLHLHHFNLLSWTPSQLLRYLKQARPDQTQQFSQQKKRLLIGGSSAPQQLRSELTKLQIESHFSYGMTEMSSTIAIQNLQMDDSASPFNLLPYRNVTEEKGLLSFSGPCLSPGHFCQDGKFESYGDQLISKDCGSLLSSTQLILRGRSDRTIIINGHNVSLEDIERFVLTHFDVINCKAVPQSHSTSGAAYDLHVELESDSSEKVILTAIKNKLCEHFPQHALPLAILQSLTPLSKGEHYEL